MTAPRPAGDGGVRACDEPFCTVTLPHHTHVDVADRAWCCGPYPYAARPASPPAGAEAGPWLATPSEPTVEAELAELADLRKRIARVRSMRDAATDGKVTVAAIDWALDG